MELVLLDEHQRAEVRRYAEDVEQEGKSDVAVSRIRRNSMSTKRRMNRKVRTSARRSQPVMEEKQLKRMSR